MIKAKKIIKKDSVNPASGRTSRVITLNPKAYKPHKPYKP